MSGVDTSIGQMLGEERQITHWYALDEENQLAMQVRRSYRTSQAGETVNTFEVVLYQGYTHGQRLFCKNEYKIFDFTALMSDIKQRMPRLGTRVTTKAVDYKELALHAIQPEHLQIFTEI